jgi:LuxR family transcriptional regulator, maltose regulon positive regulatory protein
VHLAIATRSDPALPLSHLRAQGVLCEVRAAQLQFLPEEAETFLHTTMGLNLSAEERTVLQYRTEGWITGLQLAALFLQNCSDTRQFLADFTGNHRSIVDYLVEEVLTRQSEAVQAFLLHTSILDRLTGNLCDALTGRGGSDALLEQLERANLFLIPLDERRQWYRYHHLFAYVLRPRLHRELETEELARLYARASVWYEQSGMQALAIEAALEARDFERAARLIELIARSMLMSFQPAMLRLWLERFPREVLFTQAFLCLVYAHSLFVTSATPDAHEGPLATAERLFQAEDNCAGLGQTCTLRAEVAMERGDALRAIRYGIQALQLLPEDALLERSTSANALAGGYQQRGEITAASRVLTEARLLHERSGNVPALLGDTLIQGELLVMQGKLHQAATLYFPILESAGAWQSLAIFALIGLGDIARECNELDRAEAYLEQAITLAGRTRDTMLQARASLMHARVIQARGDAGRTIAAFTQAQVLAQQCRYSGLGEQIQAYQMRSWLQQGQMNAAIRWQQAASLALDASPDYQQEVIALTLARILIARGEIRDALRLLERWHLHARAQGRTGSEIEILLLSALAQQMQGKREQAVQLLQQSLLLALPEGYVRVFVDEGVPMVALLSLVLSRWKGKTGTDEVQRLLAVVQAEPRAPDSHSPAVPRWEPPLEPLSSREHKVLRGLSAGLSNAEIAASLMVSINTVRTQARSIYRKLNVHTRHEAVALARHWQLL